MNNLLKSFLIVTVSILLGNGIGFSQDDPSHSHHGSDVPSGIKVSDGTLYGKDYDLSMPVIEFSDLMLNAADNNDKIVVVRGNVTEVCQTMGCWMVISEGTNSVRIKTKHEFFLPKDIAGTNAVVAGTFKISEISEEMAKHYNEESKNPVQSTDIIGPQKVYEIDAIGIKILNPADNTKN